MNIYFPQWQGAGTGKNIEAGARVIRDYLSDPALIEIPLAQGAQEGPLDKQFHIHNYDILTEQLGRFKAYLTAHGPEQLGIIGGDCGLEIVPVSYLNQKYDHFGVIWFDAHADINRPCDSPSCNFHGMPLRTLLGEGESAMTPLMFSTLNEDQIHYVGLRDIDKAEKKRLIAGHIYHPQKSNPQDLVNVLQSKNIKNLYLHFDFDCLDPQDYDQTYYQVPKGLKIKDAETHIKVLQEHFTIVGSSVLESTALGQDALKPIKGIIDLLLKKTNEA